MLDLVRADSPAYVDEWRWLDGRQAGELLDELRERILSRYEAQIMDALREECAPSAPPEPSGPSSDRDY